MQACDRWSQRPGPLKHACSAESGADLAAKQWLRAVKWQQQAELPTAIARDQHACAGRGMLWAVGSTQAAGETAQI
jgi:hypothetical protein